MFTRSPSTALARVGHRALRASWASWAVWAFLLLLAVPAWGQEEAEVPPELEDVLGLEDLGPLPRRPLPTTAAPPAASPAAPAPALAASVTDATPAAPATNPQPVAAPNADGPEGAEVPVSPGAGSGAPSTSPAEGNADATQEQEEMRALSASMRAHAPQVPGSAGVDLLEELLRANALVDAGRLSKALGIYERVVREAGERYPLASFNLAKVRAYRGQCEQAVLHFQAYIALGDQEEVREEARQGVQDCQSEEPWPLLHLHGMPPATRVQVNGFAVARGLSSLELALAPGTYEVDLRSADYLPRQFALTVGPEARVDVAAEMILRTFYGRLTVETSHNTAVQVQVTPLAFDSPRDHVKPFGRPAPFGKPAVLPTGRYHVRITHPDYHPWVRNVRIDRDQETRVEARLEKLLPPEIRQ